MRTPTQTRFSRGLVLGLSGALAGGLAAGQDMVPVPDGDEHADNACVQCHRDLPGRLSEIVELEWKRSSHYEAGVACNGCHGVS